MPRTSKFSASCTCRMCKLHVPDFLWQVWLELIEASRLLRRRLERIFCSSCCVDWFKNCANIDSNHDIHIVYSDSLPIIDPHFAVLDDLRVWKATRADGKTGGRLTDLVNPWLHLRAAMLLLSILGRLVVSMATSSSVEADGEGAVPVVPLLSHWKVNLGSRSVGITLTLS